MSRTEKRQKRQRGVTITADTLTPSERLSAICFAAKEAGVSYGKFSNGVTAEEKEKIYVGFAELLERQRLHENKQISNEK